MLPLYKRGGTSKQKYILTFSYIYIKKLKWQELVGEQGSVGRLSYILLTFFNHMNVFPFQIFLNTHFNKT